MAKAIGIDLGTTNSCVGAMGDRLAGDTRGQAEQAIAEVREAMSGEDLDRIRQATERLVQVSGSLTEASAQAQQKQGGAEQTGGGGEPGVVDAEFEETKKPDDRRTG